MKKTEKAYWQNGHQIRGGYFHTLNLSIGKIGIMISWEYPKKNGYKKLLIIELFQLV